MVLYVLAGCINTCAMDRDTAPATMVCRYVRSLVDCVAERVVAAVAAARTVALLWIE
jgi:hypothetical protein